MKSCKSFLFLALVACLVLSSCSGVPKGTSGGGGTANVSFVLVADTPPSSLGLVSLKVVPTAIVLTPASGTATTFSLNSGNGYSYDLVRLQSDSGFLGTVPKVATGAYSSITITFASATLAFLNSTGSALTSPACPANDICVATFSGPFTSTITSPQTISGNAGFGIDINLANAFTISGGTLSVNLGNTSTASAFTLPRQNSNLAAGQLDLIEDITGVVSIGASGVTITPGSQMNHPPITASATSSTVLDIDPTQTLCTNPTQGNVNSCVSSNQAASMDAILNSDGTFTAQEIEPLLGTLQDTVEGTVAAINSQTQFAMVVTDIIPAATNSLIGSLGITSPLTVNLASGSTFFVDSKGLPIAINFPGNYGAFRNATNTTGLHLGQTVAIHVTSFTAGSGSTLAASTANSVTLRWSRLTATVTIGATPQFTINGIPLYFNFTPSSTFAVQIFQGTPGTQGVTNLDGIVNGNPPTTSLPVAIRALFIEDPGNTLIPAFFAAKVRQH